MVDILKTFLPFLVLFSHFFIAFLLLSFIFKSPWSSWLISWVGRRAITLGFLTALVALIGSLFYSEIVGYPPCVLCWWQRVFLFPQSLLFGVALWRKKKDVFLYSIPLTVFAALLALYQQYVYMGGASLLPCTAAAGDCSKIYVMVFGYITIPMMSLTIATFLILLALYHKAYENRHS